MFLKRANGPDLAYQTIEGNADLPTVAFLTGFRSDMSGTKAVYLSDLCAKTGQSFVRFDYRGHGQSGGAFEDSNIGLWLQDAFDMIDTLTKGPIIVVGSSMGGWIGLLVSLARKDRVAGYIGLAAAPDFTRDIPKRMNETQKQSMEDRGFFELENNYDPASYKITKSLLDEGEKHCLLDSAIDLQCPVRLIQGMKDSEVPWQMAHRIGNAITTKDKKIYLREEGDHRLSQADDLELLGNLVKELSKV